jgi:hypothetical protein
MLLCLKLRSTKTSGTRQLSLYFIFSMQFNIIASIIYFVSYRNCPLIGLYSTSLHKPSMSLAKCSQHFSPKFLLLTQHHTFSFYESSRLCHHFVYPRVPSLASQFTLSFHSQNASQSFTKLQVFTSHLGGAVCKSIISKTIVLQT